MSWLEQGRERHMRALAGESPLLSMFRNVALREDGLIEVPTMSSKDGYPWGLRIQNRDDGTTAIEATSAHLHLAVGRFCREVGVGRAYRNPSQLAQRLRADWPAFVADGWCEEDRRKVNGFDVRTFARKQAKKGNCGAGAATVAAPNNHQEDDDDG